MEDQLLEKQLLEAINHIKNVNRKRVMADCLLSHLKKIGATNWDQQSINDMLCILQYKGTIDDNFTLARNEENSTNHQDIDIRISPVIFDSENSYSYFKRSFSCPSCYDLFIKSGKIATNADSEAKTITIK